MLLKVLAGIGLGVVGTIVVINITDKIERETYKKSHNGSDKGCESIKDKISDAAVKMTEKILNFAAEHLTEIQAATNIVMFALPVVELFLDIRQFRVQDRLEMKMDALTSSMNELKKGRETYKYQYYPMHNQSRGMEVVEF